jgi:hypothetical protein
MDAWMMIFMLVVLKLPVLYLGGVLWWAIKAEPRPEPPDGVEVAVGDRPDPSSPWLWWRQVGRFRPLRDGPHGAPRRVARAGRPATAKAERR